MTTEATQADDMTAADEIELMAQQAENEEAASQAEQETDPGEWEDASAQEEQAKALAKMAVQAVEMAAGMINPGHSLDANSRQHGEAVMLPVALDFSGEVPEWLRPYMHYLGAGMWIGGVMIGAYKAKRTQDAERKEEKQQQGATDGGES